MRAGQWAACLLAIAVGAGCPSDSDGEADSDEGTTGAAESSEGTTGDTSGSDGADETGTGDTGEPPPQTIPICDEADIEDVEARIDAVLSELSVGAKVGLLHGAAILPVDGTWQVAGSPDHDIPGLHMLDGPRGVSRMSGQTATAFPVASMRGATWDPELERRVGEAIAREIRATGADTLLAPTINVLRHPGWGRAQETYSEDTVHLGAMGVAFIEGVQSEHVIATAKHYAANSIEDTRFDVDVTLDAKSLREVYLPHFRRAVTDARVAAVMTAYNSVNGAYCDQNAPLVRDILKQEWGYGGLVMSDWIYGTHSNVESLRAGLDIEMPTGQFFSGLASAVSNGELEEAELDAAVRRVLRVQWCFGLDVDPPVVDPDVRESDEHLALAREVARRGLVLLRNEGALPLSLAAGDELVVVGSLADVANIGDEGSSAVDPSEVITALEGLAMRAETGGVELTHLDTDVLAPPEQATVSNADAVIVVAGLTDDNEGEGLIAAGDRDSLLLPAEQVELITAVAATGTPMVVVLYGGGTIVVSDWVEDVDALMLAFYPGSEGGHALAEVLFGDAGPTGRLPFSVPVAEADLVEFDHVSLAVTYGYLHGYRHLDANATPAQFPFGFGLDYTELVVGEVALSTDTLGTGETLTATVAVSNEGSRAGTQTVQLYVGHPDDPAPRELKAFGQITLPAGESGTVELPVSADDLQSWTDEGWVLRAGTYTVEVGTSAGDLPFATTIEVTG